MRPSSKTVVFLHVPKTGGTTFYKILERNYGRTEVLTFDGVDHRAEIERFAKSTESKRARYQLIQGHLHFGLHRFIPGDSTYVTCLREPIARVLSFYAYARNQSGHYLHHALIKERLDLKALLERNGTPELFNHQTRMIAGDPSNLNSAVDRSSLEIAKQNLCSKFSFVGLTEEFDASLILLCQMFGWEMPFYVKRNVTREKVAAESLDAQTRALLRGANALDSELYQFARTLFEAKRRAAGAAFEAELIRFQQLNSKSADMSGDCGNVWERLRRLFRGSPKPVATLKRSAAGPSI